MLSQDLETKLNKAIEKMDLETIDKLLKEAENISPPCPSLEEPKLFAKQIMKNNSKMKGYDYMKFFNKKQSIIASIALVFIASTTVLYATGVLNKITIFKDDGTYTITSDTPLTQEQANVIIEDFENTPKATPNETNEVKHATFYSIEEVSKAVDLPIVLPEILPKDFTLSKEITTESYEFIKGHPNYNIYLSFDGPKASENLKDNSLFQVSIIKNDNTGLTERISSTDSVYQDTYTNAQGDTYTLFDEDGATIAQITMGDIEYCLCFYNISEEEIHNIIDSTDLTAYK